ncbi:MAG: hypothetical protein N3F04_02755 [Candidatus Nezhaarchaeota archaeon]|nr:hypothetical protein [Candidatus Nezhaarchaeota archaeon]MCX8141690.1 hypothetical protein [Candidatus Nezhaarchaeota archaeon]MDW8049957.1 hypothetical protein [Nitrososphaerota archaeon]
MNLRCLAVFVLLALTIIIQLPTGFTKGVEEANATLYTRINIYYTHVDVTYTLQFEGPSESFKVSLKLNGFSNLYASYYDEIPSTSWTVEVPSLGEGSRHNITIKTMWMMECKEGTYSIDIPLNPSASIRLLNVSVMVDIPPNTSTFEIKNLNYTLADNIASITILDIPPHEVVRLQADLAFNYIATPWLFKTKKLIRDIDLESKVVIDHVTLESLYYPAWRSRQTILHFNITADLGIIEIGDLAGPFRSSTSLNPGEFNLVNINGTTVLQVRPRVSLSLGERTTIYIKYKVIESDFLRLMPSYAPYVDELEVKVHVPEGSKISKATPEPHAIEGTTVIYRLTNVTQLLNPQLRIEYLPPLLPLGLIPAIGLTVTIIAASSMIVLRRRILIKLRPKILLSEIKKLQEVFSSYVELAYRIWRLHEDYIEGRVRDSTYRKRIHELKPQYLECIGNVKNSVRKLKKVSQLASLSQRLDIHLERALKFEEDLAAATGLRKSKKLTSIEWAQKVEILKKEIGKLKDETREINSELKKAIA